MNSDYEKAKRIFQSLRKRLNEGTAIPSKPDSDKHLQIVKNAVREQYQKEKPTVAQSTGQQRKQVFIKPRAQRNALRSQKKGQNSKETGIIIASDVPSGSSKMIADLAAKITAAKEVKAASAPITRRTHRRKGRQVKQSKA